MSGCADFICHHEINTGISLPLDVLTSGNQGESDEAVWGPFSCVFPSPTLTVFALPALPGFDNAAHLSSANISRHSLSSMPTHQHLPFFCFQPSLHILAYLGTWPLISSRTFFELSCLVTMTWLLKPCTFLNLWDHGPPLSCHSTFPFL